MTQASPPAVTAPTVPQKLGLRNYLGYATGDAANNLAFSMSSSFLLLYYTNVVGLPIEKLREELQEWEL